MTPRAPIALLLILLPVLAPAKDAQPLRVATYNIRELSTTMLSAVNAKGTGRDPQVLAAARIIQEVKPDILVVNEIDHDYTTPNQPLELNAQRFVKNYLAVGPHGIEYPYIYAGPCNTGILSGHDLDNDGTIATATDSSRVFGNDCYGYGNYPGQYSMALLSKYPIDAAAVRTMQKFLWKDLPGNHIPPGYYSEAELADFRLSSKSHWDIPVQVNGKTIHLLLSHPTPQGFDGAEDKNGRRNFDEIKLWVDYVAGNPALYDDKGGKGGIAADASFLIAGDLNASPVDGSKFDGQLAITQLLTHPRIQDTGSTITGKGGLRGRAGGAPKFIEQNTFGGMDNVRIDYLLPSKDLQVVGGGVWWPDAEENLEGCILAEYASDHRLIWVDIAP
jgi:hypothetical protein